MRAWAASSCMTSLASPGESSPAAQASITAAEAFSASASQLDSRTAKPMAYAGSRGAIIPVRRMSHCYFAVLSAATPAKQSAYLGVNCRGANGYDWLLGGGTTPKAYPSDVRKQVIGRVERGASRCDVKRPKKLIPALVRRLPG